MRYDSLFTSFTVTKQREMGTFCTLAGRERELYDGQFLKFLRILTLTYSVWDISDSIDKLNLNSHEIE